MIDLYRESLVSEIKEGQHVWPLKITAQSLQEGLSSAIFVFHASMGDDPYDGDVFEVVASVQQMRELPENSPGSDINGQLVPYYRKNSVTWYARSPREAEDLWHDIVEDVDDLTRNWAAASNLGVSGSTSTTIVLRQDINGTGRNISNIERLGIRTLSPGAALDIDPEGDPTLPEEGIRLGGDVSLYRTGPATANVDATVNIRGSLLVNGLPIQGAVNNYVHTQPTPSDTWNVVHNLGFFPNVSVKDTAGSLIFGDVNYIDSTRLTISFNGLPISGTAYIS